MAENCVHTNTNTNNASTSTASDTVHDHINDFLVCSGLGCSVCELNPLSLEMVKALARRTKFSDIQANPIIN
jgi:hypothetical protein